MDDKHAEADKTVTQSNTGDDGGDESPTPIACEITLCGSPALDHVEHPQRGEMVVCNHHAREIEKLPTWRFVGSDDRWSEVAR